MVDLSFLKKFTKGDNTKMKKYISMYLAMAPDSFERMRQNIKEKAWHELAVNAHSFKPQADYMGIATLKDLMTEIERKAKIRQLDNLESLYEKAISIHHGSVGCLQKFINDH